MENQLLIRTMKDDIAGVDFSSKVEPSPTTKQENTKPQAPVFTLPTKKPIAHSETITTPPKKNRNIAIGVGYLVLFCVIAGGAFYGYMKWDGIQVFKDSTNKQVSFFQLIPREALALIHYKINSEEDRNSIRQMWSEAGNTSEGSATSGDPTSLLQIPDISGVYYLLIPGGKSPYLLIEKTEGAKEYVAQYSEEQVLENGNWYVVHADKVDEYTVAIAEGSIDENSSLLASTDSASYMIRYALNAKFVSQQFNSPVAVALGLSHMDALVFHVTGPTNDNTIRASALIAGEPPGEGVVEGTAELMTLIPSDITFGRVGFNFAEDSSLLAEDSPQFDTTVLAQPAVRQFIALFTTPYAIFERKGSDGVPDTGLIIAIPSSLKQKIKTGEPIIEQSLPALIPLIIGKMLGIQVAFNDGEYEKIPLRYINLIGQTQTIDYAVGDNFLLISSSLEGMNTLLDTSLATNKGFSVDEPWKSLSEKAAEIIKDRLFVVGSLTDPAMMSILPVANTLSQIPVIASSGRTSTGTEIQVVLSTK
ncbi:MAG: hypothetical protein O3A36_01905 [bacterium]|nr:hypothetical protein [bacterium]